MAVALEKPMLEKLQTFLNDNGYTELTQNTARYNVRIRKDRLYRQPYIDGQTGVAQRHCHLFVSDKERMPGILQGQVYTYPSRRWRTSHRSYLASFMQVTRTDPDEHTITTVENPAAFVAPPVQDEIPLPEKPIKEPWTYYDENTYEEDLEDAFESEEDFDDETYNNKKGSKRRKTIGRKPKARGKKKLSKTPSKLIKNIKKEESTDPDHKPYVCELCGMRYKTRPGLTYHYAHSHKDEDEKDKPIKQTPNPTKPSIDPSMPMDSTYMAQATVAPEPTVLSAWTESNGIAALRTPNKRPVGPLPPNHPMMMQQSAIPQPPPDVAAAIGPPPTIQPTPVPMAGTVPAAQEVLEEKKEEKKPVPPSPYCDFCLGDATVNKKSGQPEQLVSCADCGRSGHPSCLQFTENMKKSVLRYRWQCIECKTCTLCGTSENDDQLLFCDDCDRGYHLYCLIPPLSEPPEGEWSCDLCIREFHNK